MKYQKLIRTKEYKPESIGNKLAKDFDMALVDSTLSYFKDLNNMTKFEKDVYTDYNQTKKTVNNQLDYNVKTRSHLSIKFLYGLQCNDELTHSMK